MDEKEKQIKEGILARIRSGRVNMRPKWHFLLRAALFGVGTALLGLAILYLTSFILFVTDASGTWFAPNFGPQGWVALFRSLPWLLILLSILFMALLEALVQRYTFAYRTPLLYSALVIALLALAGGLLAAPFHRGPFGEARRHHLPMFAERFYHDFGPAQERETYRGTVRETTDDGFILEDFRGETSSIVVSPFMHMGRMFRPSPGEEIVVFGSSSGTVVEARAFRLLGR